MSHRLAGVAAMRFWVKSALFSALVALCVPCTVHAQPSKDTCVEAHSQGQDAREQGKLTMARKLFITCAQAACPALVQSDCARFADELSQQQPSLSFAARDAAGHDLPDTSVVLDGRLLTTRVDGTLHEVDPGKHIVRFTNAGREQLLTLVVASGERGRTVVATFGAPPGSTVRAALPAVSGGTSTPPRIRRPGAVAGLVGLGALTVAGGVMVGLGMSKIPDSCTLSTHRCAAPPGDPAFDDAATAVRVTNAGFIVGGLGALLLGAGIVWYVKTGKPGHLGETALAPWGTRDGAGLVLRSRL